MFGGSVVIADGFRGWARTMAISIRRFGFRVLLLVYGHSSVDPFYPPILEIDMCTIDTKLRMIDEYLLATICPVNVIIVTGSPHLPCRLGQNRELGWCFSLRSVSDRSGRDGCFHSERDVQGERLACYTIDMNFLYLRMISCLQLVYPALTHQFVPFDQPSSVFGQRGDPVPWNVFAVSERRVYIFFAPGRFCDETVELLTGRLRNVTDRVDNVTLFFAFGNLYRQEKAKDPNDSNSKDWFRHYGFHVENAATVREHWSWSPKVQAQWLLGLLANMSPNLMRHLVYQSISKFSASNLWHASGCIHISWCDAAFVWG